MSTRKVNRTLKPSKVRFIVEVEIDCELSDPLVLSMSNYVEEAVAIWKGQINPDNALQHIEHVHVLPTHILNRSKGRWIKLNSQAILNQ